jgi:hypothetical protein
MATKEERILAIKSSLRKQFPKLSEEKIKEKAFKIFNSQSKKQRFSKIHGYEFKTLEDGTKVPKGYLATTHLDSGFLDENRGVFVRDRIPQETFVAWKNEIDNGNPRANKMSVYHDRIPHVAGLIKDVEIHDLGDGEYGLFGVTPPDETREDYDQIKYRLDNGFLDSYSIEFTTKDVATGEYLPGAVREIEHDGWIERILLPGTILEGATYASQPMNENAIMIKEVRIPVKQKKEFGGNATMVENKEDQKPEGEGEAKPEDNGGEAKPEGEGQEEKTDKKTVENKELPKGDAELLVWAKEQKEKQVKEAQIKEFKEEVMNDIKESLKTVKVEDKTLNNGEDKGLDVEIKELVEYKQIFDKEAKLTISEQLKIAGKTAEKIKAFKKSTKSIDRTKSGGYDMSIKDLSTKSQRCIGIEMKGLGITTNQGSLYNISAAELSDVYGPVINNILNQKTTTWNLLTKEDWSGRNSNNVTFKVKTVTNPTAGAYTGNAISLGNGTRIKYQTKFKKYAVGFEVDGDMDAVSDGLQIEIASGTEDLMSVINVALFAEVGLETAAGVIGFEYITDQAGNTTLYSETSRTQANGLASTTTADNYINGASADLSITNLRAAKRKVVGTEGADANNVIYIGSFIQGDKLRGIYDAAQRPIPTSSRFGFEGMMSFDGYPFFEDKDCNDDDVFMVDLATHKIAIFVPPTVIMMGIDSDSTKGFVKTYFATYNTAPRKMVQIYANATT